MRVAPPRVFPTATGAARPPAGAEGSVDAYRQTGFVLGGDLDLVLEGLNLESSVAAASNTAKFRTQLSASTLTLWSRGWLARLQALHAVQWGNYGSAIALVRSAADHHAALLYLLRTDAAEWQQWLDDGGIGLAADLHATEFQLHAFRSAEVLAAEQALGEVYRASTNLSLPHFGATVLLTAQDSDAGRVVPTFGDRDFHLALAELILGWLLSLSLEQLSTVTQFPSAFARLDAVIASRFRETAAALLTASQRCRTHMVEREGMTRRVIENWRRSPGSAAKRVLL